MPTYTVIYETDVYPARLPEGARVEEKSLLPLRFITDGTEINVQESVLEGYKAYIEMHGAAHLNEKETRQLIEALRTSLGEVGKPRRYKDRSGDIWHENPDGTLSCPIDHDGGTLNSRYFRNRT